MVLAIRNGRIYTPDVVLDGGVILIEGGVIAAVGRLEVPADAHVIDAGGMHVVPGFIDIHIHGLLGHDVMGPALADAIPLLPRYGVTAFVPTTLTAPVAETLAALNAMADTLEHPPAGAEPLGIHIEGPHLSPRRAGMHRPEWLHPLTWAEFEAFQRAARGHIRMLTFAPEETGDGPAMVARLSEAGVIPVIGHSDATFAQVTEYVAAGLAHATHTFNAMRGFHHREPGVLGAVLNYDPIIAQLIADGHHVHPAAMALLLRIKGVDRVCLVSDAAPLAGLPPGEYEWGSTRVLVDEGVCRFPDGTLASAAVLLDTGVRTLVNQVGLSLREALVPATRVPADVLGVRKGRLRPGWDADVVLLDEALRVQLTLVRGQARYAGDLFAGVL
ncbi:MAG: N-acetylglucosamine-6-phosphate deacetylase [Chloroflexi bacterium]|nr:MAG: N-acetylglucosamine-6-phosphate deacetylase [Chloroflexota bacterium]